MQHRYDMSKEVNLETLVERIEKLEQHIETHCLRLDDVQDSHKALVAQVNDYQSRVEKLLSYANEKLVTELYKTLGNTSDEFREQFNKLLSELRESVKKEVATSRILVVRPATREELKDGKAVPVRQATAAETRK